MKFEAFRGLWDILDVIDTYSDAIKPHDLTGFMAYYNRVCAATRTRALYASVGSRDELLLNPAYQDDPAEPIPLLLYCPVCHTKHVDVGEFANKPHHTHSCQGFLANGRPCGLTWRPALVHTVGVDALPGFLNIPFVP